LAGSMGKSGNSGVPVLSPADAAFLPRRTSMSIAARDAQTRPVVARAFGCRVSQDRRQVTIFLSTTHSPLALQCLRENSVIALAVTRPTTHETLQLKGRVVGIAPVTAADLEEMTAYQDSVLAEIRAKGYTPEFVRAVFGATGECVAVSFELTALFNQTPGPHAGEKLAAS
jgi:hypothetical protein